MLHEYSYESEIFSSVGVGEQLTVSSALSLQMMTGAALSG